MNRIKEFMDKWNKCTSSNEIEDIKTLLFLVANHIIDGSNEVLVNGSIELPNITFKESTVTIKDKEELFAIKCHSKAMTMLDEPNMTNEQRKEIEWLMQQYEAFM